MTKIGEKPKTLNLAHMINPVIVPESSDLFVAQPITFQTMKNAQAQAQGKVNVTLYSTQYPEDESIVPDGFVKTPNLETSVLDVGKFAVPRKLPLIKDILDRLYEASPNADYLIYTNVDIGLQPHFYTDVAKFIEQGYDSFVINRRTISDSYKSVADIPLMYAEKGERHPGHDCFIFKRSLYPKFNLGLVCIGTIWIGKCFYINCLLNSDKFAQFKDLYLTFHVGEDGSWRKNKKKFKDYTLHNSQEMIKIMRKYEEIQQLPYDPVFEKYLAIVERLEQEQKWYNFIIRRQRLVKNWLTSLLNNGKR
ncbi:MAG: hypothetical protein F6K48_33770 [Okeania sp. SIO3H1]|uniref:hypothetical protein n=1 Tax=Okeania sp. SIO1I7 TaxID=2607772 RepID=UPI0013CD7D23|nr:hypothetical protein [Okeania sp. SIO1I7]NEN93580.1 hypothetical protein [Okeania sp. SIO3H1]NET27424.1 hypothetical protein [Okeania sp. SIO1I7]